MNTEWLRMVDGELFQVFGPQTTKLRQAYVDVFCRYVDQISVGRRTQVSEAWHVRDELLTHFTEVAYFGPDWWRHLSTKLHSLY